MTDELKQKAQEALVTIIDDALKAHDFVIEQAPDVIQQLLTYHLVFHLAFFLVGLLVFIALHTGSWVVVKKWPDDYERGAQWGIFALMNLFGILIGITFIGRNLVWIKIWLAPKIFLLEYAADLVR